MEVKLHEMDKKIEEIKKIQALLDGRTKAEEQAIEEIKHCRFDKANKILNGM